MSDPTGTYSFGYDNVGRLNQTTTNYSFLTARTLANAYTYDAASNRLSFTDPESGVTSYTYDTLNRLTGLTDFNGHAFAFSYDSLGRRTNLARANGVSTNYTYDTLSHLLSIVHQRSGVMASAAYTYDVAGNRTSLTASATGTSPVSASFGYDPLYELTQVVANTTPPTTTESYNYDKVGNRLSSLNVSPYAYNSSNQLTSKPGVTYTYDANGNLTSKTDSTGTTSYSWDFENRLTSVTLPGAGGTVSFKYDPFGRRIQKSSASGTTSYSYDGDNITEELNASGTAVARYTQGLGIDEPLVMYRAGVASYYHADGLGSIAALTSAAGFPTAAYLYESFGNLLASAGSVVNPLRYTAREFDTETGLYYYRARYYDAGVGRFLAEDSARFASGTYNFFTYVDNSPLNFRDPSGNQRSGSCCQENIDIGKKELEDTLNNAQLMHGRIVRKYKDCLLKFPEMKIKCDPSAPGCGNHNPLAVDTIVITPLGSKGRKGPCEPVASTFLHEMVHICYQNDLSGKPLTGLDQEREAFQAECDVFGYGCACARDPRKCAY